MAASIARKRIGFECPKGGDSCCMRCNREKGNGKELSVLLCSFSARLVGFLVEEFYGSKESLFASDMSEARDRVRGVYVIT